MNVIILAAGQGNRLRPLTNDKPKCLVELFGKSLLNWQLDIFQKLKINDISIVKGYLQEQITFPNINFYENKNESIEHSNLPDEIRIGAVLRDKKVIIPKSDFIFLKDDQIVLIVKKDTVGVVENLFRLSSV